MKISERIKAIECHGKPYTSYAEGFDDAKDYCTTIATEADGLMADLAESLQKLMILTDGGGTWTLEDQDRAQAALKNYREYVK